MYTVLRKNSKEKVKKKDTSQKIIGNYVKNLSTPSKNMSRGYMTLNPIIKGLQEKELKNMQS